MASRSGCTLGPLFKLQANVGLAKTIPEHLENHRHMVLAGVVRDVDIRHDRTVEVSATDVLEIVANTFEVEAEKAFPRPKIPKLEKEMGWTPFESFETGLRKTIQWYLDNPKWLQRVISGDYREWIKQHYQEL